MKFSLPAWDREFFRLDLAAITLELGDTPAALRRQLAERPAGLYYLFLDSALEAAWEPELTALGARAYGHRAQFSHTLTDVEGSIENVAPAAIAPAAPDEALYRLAIAGGSHSRFRLDPRLSPHFERLYRRWLDLAFEAPEEHFLLAMPDGGGFSGLLLGSVREAAGRIELLAVAETARRRGLGQALYRQATGQFRRRGVRSVAVATQLENQAACHFYEKAGFQLQSSTAAWHLWAES